MPLTSGSRLGPYEIAAPIGAGGMGEVYRAKDTTLGREVAIKVLPAAMASDPERLARFKREAQVLASLNHSNIAHVYGFESALLTDGSTAHVLAMELVEGEDLAERLRRGAIPVDEAIAIAKQIAEGLEEAHERGIIHRDLKPANVKVTPDGKVKVLDFGLAKALEGDPVSSEANSQLSHSPTMSRHATEAGMIMGTAAYMSPEQARAKPVDKRADIWSFGVVLFEMLTGERLFSGETVSDVLAAVLTRDPNLETLPARTPNAVRQLVRGCLERDPRRRLRDIGDARRALSEADHTHEERAAPSVIAPKPSWARQSMPWVAGFALGALITGVVDRTLLRRSPSEPPKLIPLTYSGRDFQPTASLDGRTIAFTSTRDGKSRIWLKQLATGEEVALTSGPADFDPHFSPDGNTLLFLRGAVPPVSLFRVAIVGGDPRRVADGVATSATWAPDGKHVAVTRASTPGGVADTLVTLGADGGEEREVARLNDAALASLRWSPDGAAIGALATLSTNAVARQWIAGFDATSGARKTLYQPPPGSVLGGWSWSGPRALLITETANLSGRGGSGGSRLLRIDLREGSSTILTSFQQPSFVLDVAGPDRVVIDMVSPTQNLSLRPLAPGSKAISVSFLTRGDSIDRQPIFSPDGARVAFTSDRGGSVDVWELDMATGGLRRLTVGDRDDWDPGFSPDGKQLLWSSNRSGNYEIWIAASDGGGARKVTADGVDAENPTMTSDGRWIVYASANPAKNGIWKIHPDGTGAEVLVKGPMSNPELSPDGRWVAFADGATSRLRVVALADGEDVATIDIPASVAPGTGITIGRSRWVPGSSTLIWVDYDVATATSRLLAQEISGDRGVQAKKRLLLAGTLEEMPESFAISPDGRQLLVSLLRGRSSLLLVEGLGGVTR